MPPRRAVLLTPSITTRLSRPSCGAELRFRTTNPLPVAHYYFKSFSCNTYGSPRKCCKQETYGQAKPFRCNTYKKQGWRPLDLGTGHSPLFSRHWTQILSFHILAHSFALFCIGGKLNPFLFNRFRTLCPKTPGVGVPLLSPTTIASTNGNALPAAMGAAAKRAHRLQERRSCVDRLTVAKNVERFTLAKNYVVKSVVGRRRRRRRVRPPERVNEHF